MRKTLMPQEVELYYVIPALRRELAKELSKNSLKQKEIAQTLGLTEAAVSNYLKNKRASELKFEKNTEKEIRQAAAKIIKNPSTTTRELYNLTVRIRGTKAMCQIHKKHDSTIPHNCEICAASEELTQIESLK